MILIGVGSNLAHKGQTPSDIIGLAQKLLAQKGVRLLKASSLYQTRQWGRLISLTIATLFGRFPLFYRHQRCCSFYTKLRRSLADCGRKNGAQDRLIWICWTGMGAFIRATHNCHTRAFFTGHLFWCHYVKSPRNGAILC